MLTDEQIREALRPLCKDETALDMLLETSMDEYRAIEAAVLAEAAKDREDAERYRWLCEKLGETQLPVLIERITTGYVADYKPSIDAAIDAARSTT